MDFAVEVLYSSLSNRNETLELQTDYRHQANIELDPKSFGFYKIISNGHYYFTKEFNTRDISEGFVIYEKLSIYLFHLF